MKKGSHRLNLRSSHTKLSTIQLLITAIFLLMLFLCPWLMLKAQIGTVKGVLHLSNGGYGKSDVAHIVFGSARLPNPKLTPGKTSSATKNQLCAATFRTPDIRNVPDSLKLAVYKRYGLTPNAGYCTPKPYKTKTGKTVMQGCEVDHLISLELGGSNDIENLWPQPYAEVPGAHQKDVVETWLHNQVCSGKVTLAKAQHDISTNWLLVYQQAVKSK